MAKKRMAAVVVCAMAATALMAQQAPVGISRALARERAARVSDVHYKLRFALVPHAVTTEGVEELRFALNSAAEPLLLDFRDGTVESVTVNDTGVTVAASNGHIALPAAALRRGANAVFIHFHAGVAAAGKAITRYEDKDDGGEYLYTLFVPMDAEMAFPCFDQPDLKARFDLTLDAPTAWTVISNTAAVQTQTRGEAQVTETHFAETAPISTYLFAFAAGPFVEVHKTAGLPGVYVRRSKAANAANEATAIQQTAAFGMRYLGEYFAQPYPFAKYDMVLIPGFAYGGMEHAGATFLREEGVIFRTAPTESTLVNRDILVLHELTHQWFGDFTTMRWFDDLWLKEGFAQYMAYKTLAVMRPQDAVWKRFYQSIKPVAYGIDETQGTTPIYQDIPNLKDAKSAYGAIVYQKAPGVLRQLEYVIGEAAFRKGLQTYLAGHKYGNADWSDLIAALEKASGQSLQAWAEMWIRHKGMPEVQTTWTCEGARLRSLELKQHPVLGGEDVWPLRAEVALGYADGSVKTVAVRLEGKAVQAQVAGMGCPAYVFANHDDHAYGLFVLDPVSRAYVLANVGKTQDVFARTMLWGALWDAVRMASLAPAEYVRAVARDAKTERDESLLASMLGRSQTALHRYLSATQRASLSAALETLAADRMAHDTDKDLRITWFRTLPGVAEQEAGRATLKALLRGELEVPGVTLWQQDRWALVTTLLAYGDPEADAVLAAEVQRDPSGDAKKYAYVAGAARPDAAVKRRYFTDYTANKEIAEDWVESSLGAFNSWNESAITAPFLPEALAALPTIKQTRKIFFLGAWLSAFIGGQQSAEAQAQVRAALQAPGLDKDLRLKILEAEDELDRTVRIRAKFAGD